ncbi:hypothetical protein [Pseudonocardia nigra]|uniref:hypothetical protein n=1 Tax=Pseudonocardia nigra TaxID=1921578 RepID=UPI001C5E9185|nr:hypothetical protein [Pseudonocardia nigra]
MPATGLRQTPYFHPDMAAVMGAQLAAADALLLGRRTYEEFVGYGPQQSVGDNPMTARMNAIPKLVASTTLDTVSRENSVRVGGDLAAALTRRRQQGENVQVTGSRALRLAADGARCGGRGADAVVQVRPRGTR